MTEHTPTESLSRIDADRLGRTGILEKMRQLYPAAGLTHCLFDHDWPSDEDVWCLGDPVSILVRLTGTRTTIGLDRTYVRRTAQRAAERSKERERGRKLRRRRAKMHIERL